VYGLLSLPKEDESMPCQNIIANDAGSAVVGKINPSSCSPCDPICGIIGSCGPTLTAIVTISGVTTGDCGEDKTGCSDCGAMLNQTWFVNGCGGGVSGADEWCFYIEDGVEYNACPEAPWYAGFFVSLEVVSAGYGSIIKVNAGCHYAGVSMEWYLSNAESFACGQTYTVPFGGSDCYCDCSGSTCTVTFQ
jgi:hypothetical protein